MTLQPGCFDLATNSGSLGYSGSVPGNQTYGTGITDDGGIALLNASNVIIDQVGMSAGSAYKEGTPLASLGSSNLDRGYERKPGGASGNGTDTDNNSSDFASVTPSQPQNMSSPCVAIGGGDAAPTVTSTSPASSATAVAVNSTIVINFNESVTATSGAFSVACPTGTPVTFAQTSSPASSFTLTPTSALPNGTTCTVKVTASQIADTDTNDPPDNLPADYSFSFTTVSAADTAPTVLTTSPVNGASNVAANSAITVNFSESVAATTSSFSVVCAGNAQGFSLSASPAASFTLTPTSSLPANSSCTVTVVANQVADTDANDPPDTMAADVSFTFSTPPAAAGKVMINEVDADTPGTDTAEFIELYDGGTGFTPLDGMVLVLFNGTDPDSLATNDKRAYAAFDLDGYTTDANGYFTLGNPGVAGASLLFEPGEFGLLQNGPDAVALYIGNASDFPVGTLAVTTNLQDAIVYGTDDPAASGLLPLLNAGQKIVNENATGNSQTMSSQRCPAGMGGFRNTSQYYPGTPTPNAANTCPAPRAPSDVVISQIYGGGGNSGATYANDFIELYNKGTATVDLTGWSLQYASSTGSGWDGKRQPLGGSVGAGEYYLISLASGGANGAPLPAANVTGQINMAAGSGKIALVKSFTSLSGGCPLFDPTIADFVGFGSADCGEGSTTTAAGSNTTALFRKGSGATDTDNNSQDFLAPTSPTPHRTAAIVELGPNVLSTDPRTNGNTVPRDATIDVTFTEAVTTDANWFTLTCSTTGVHTSATFASSNGGRDQYITPNDNFIAGETCTVTVIGNRIHDVDLDDAAPNTDTLPANYSWSFTVATGTEPPFAASVHLTMGNPSAANSDPTNYQMEKPEFAMSYNRDLGRPNWVSWHLSSEWTGSLSRVDTFRPDPQVPQDWYRVQSFDFAGSGFDRGHMTPNADRDKETSSPINQATFLMSNMVAQAPGNNQGPWASLEGYLRSTYSDSGLNELYIVAGPYGVGGTGSNGGVTTTLADGHVTVPAYTWKVALVLPKADGDDRSRVNCSTRTIAVLMPNTDNIRSDAWQNYLTTVDAIESLTGYDFFSNLPEPYQRCIEAGTDGVNPPLVKGDQAISFAPLADSTYGAAPFTVSATGGLSGNPVTFSATGSCLSGGAFGDLITIRGAGSCTVTASQAGSDIYNAAPDVARTFTVNKAAATIAVTGFSGTYDALPRGASGAATGVNSEDLSVLLHLGAVFTNAPGGTAHWTFDGNENYAAAAGDVAVDIARAATSIVAGGPVVAEVSDGMARVNGAVVAGQSVLAGQTVTVTLSNGSVAATTQSTGVFEAVLSPVGLSVAGSPFTITMEFAGSENYAPSSATTALTLIDSFGPTIDAHANEAAEATSASGAAVTYTAPSTHDLVDGAGTAVCAPASGSVFAIGSTTVTCTATDANGNSATPVTFTVTVSDTTAPTIDAPATVTALASGATGAAVTYTAPATHDAVDGNGTALCAPASGSVFAIGSTTVTCTATDAHGNSATPVTFTVTVTAPSTPGEMKGDGVVLAGGDRYHFEFDVRESAAGERGRLQLEIDYAKRTVIDKNGRPKQVEPEHGKFRSTGVTFVAFSDDPTIRPGRERQPQVDTVLFTGTGVWNGQVGHSFEVRAQDEGEPGRHRESVSIVIRNSAGQIVAQASGDLASGNVQSSRIRHN